MTDQRVIGGDHSRKFFAMIPHMADDDLNLWEYRLYGHYVRICGEKGQCDETENTTRNRCGISRQKLREARDSLAAKGFITIVQRGTPNAKGKKGTPTIIEINDIWLANATRYSERKGTETDSIDKINGTEIDTKCTEIDTKCSQIDTLTPLDGTQADTKCLGEYRKKNIKTIESKIERNKDSIAPTGAAPQALGIPASDILSGFVKVIEVVATFMAQNQTDDEPSTDTEQPQPVESPSPVQEQRLDNPSDWALMVEAVRDVFNVRGTYELNIVHMLRGTATKGEYAACNLDVPATPAEVRKFREWYFHETEGIGIPQKPAKIQSWFIRFREWRAQHDAHMADQTEKRDVPVANPSRPEYPYSNFTEEQHQRMDAALRKIGLDHLIATPITPESEPELEGGAS